jgi:hypothetical protein
MAKQKAKVKSHFTHQGKAYQPGEMFEGEEHEIANLAQQGHLEHPGGAQPGQQTQPGSQGQQTQSQGKGTDPSKPQGH